MAGENDAPQGLEGILVLSGGSWGGSWAPGPENIGRGGVVLLYSVDDLQI
jgi:hypothetical protein